MPTLSPPRPRSRSRPLVRTALSAKLLLTGIYACLPGGAAAVNFGGHEFFASVQACIAARKYEKRVCVNAFANSMAEVKERQLAFPSRADCVFRFRLCEKIEAGAEASAGRAFAPVLLGVEISNGPKGLLAAPVFAVETSPDLFPAKPIVQAAPPSTEEIVPEAPEEPVGLPVDHFTHVNSGFAGEGWRRFQLRRAKNGEPVAVIKEEPTRETPAQRRERIRNAPFVD